MHKAAQLVAELVPGKRVSVVVAGKEYTLPHVPEPHVVEPSQLELAIKKLIDSDDARFAVFEAFEKSFAKSIDRVDTSMGAVAASQDNVVRSIGRLEGTLHLPVKPVYDKSGKMIGAQRTGTKVLPEVVSRVLFEGNTVAETLASVATSINKLEGTLHLPVKPIYDKAGKLIGAQRQKP